MAGYSGTPLPQKLGIKPGHRVALVNAPNGFVGETLVPLPGDFAIETNTRRGSFDVIVFFTRSAAELGKRFLPLARRLVANGGLWVAWPKQASGVPTDLGEGEVRAIGLAAGLVDNKVCAVDTTWSGLRFVIRLRDRPPRK